MESAQYHYYLLYRMTCFMGVKTLAETILALFKAAPQYFAGTKPKWSVPFNVPTKIEWKAPNIIIIYYIE